MDESKIIEAVETCLALAIGTDRPFGRVTEFLSSLKVEPKRTDAEISENQMRIIRALMIRFGAEKL
jgi:hypothetical protein